MNGSAEQGLTRRRFVGLLAAGTVGSLAASLLSACVEPSTNHHTVNISDVGHFVPGSISIPKGDSIVWNNMDVVSHTATCDPTKAQNRSDVQLPNGAQPFNSGVINPGASWSYQFNTPGTYVYFSINEETSGLIGTIVVNG